MQLAGSFIQAQARHRVAANVLMVVFVLAGLWAIRGIQTRFFPEFEVSVATVNAGFEGANAAEIQDSIVVPLENELRDMPELKSMNSYARNGSGRVVLEFPDGTDMTRALEDIKTRIRRANLPGEADRPTAALAKRIEDVLVMTVATANRDELRGVARRVESDLRARGIVQMQISGLPTEEIQILVDQGRLLQLGLTLEEVGRALRDENQQLTVGTVAGSGDRRTVRGGSESTEFHELYQIPIATAPGADPVYLRDLAYIRRVIEDDQIEIAYNGKPAAHFQLINSGSNDIIGSAQQLYAWRDDLVSRFPDSVDIVFHDEDWADVQGRLQLLVANGAGGLAIVLCILFVFLSFPVALWVAVGIPVAMLGTLFVFHLIGGTFNMVSMFALIMAVGIIVDDAIVVGENAQFRLSRGAPPLRAVTSAARTMFVPVFASSFTTIASFLPLLIVGGTIGAIIFDIPVIIVCILIAALLECFLILPGHLYHSFTKAARARPRRFRAAVERGFDAFRNRVFRPTVAFAANHASATCAACFMLLALAVGLMVNGLVPYRFFPGAEGSKISAQVVFHSGTSRQVMEAFVDDAIGALEGAEREAGGGATLIEHVTARYGHGGQSAGDGDEKARIDVELTDPDRRSLSTQQFARQWRSALGPLPASIERLSLRGERRGPPDEDLEIELFGSEIGSLKLAALQLQDALAKIPGVNSVGDDTAYGRDEYIFRLTPLGLSLGLDVDGIARQLRFALDGFHVQTFTEGVDETKLKILLDGRGADALASTYIRLPNRQFVQLGSVVSWQVGQGFDAIWRKQGRTAITVTGAVDEGAELTPSLIVDRLAAQDLPELARIHGIDYSFAGSHSRHGDALRDMTYGLALALVLIFITLTLVFRSWSLPVVVMVTMPLGVIGTLFGHWAMGLTMSILSFFGMFTLMGIIVNNSIVLVRCFQDLAPNIADRASYNAAIVEAACLRLRAVLLTTLTTIGGLLPLMFETSRQAQFLIPMAASIVFGLAFASVLILLFTPACIALHGACGRTLLKLKAVRVGLPRLRISP